MITTSDERYYDRGAEKWIAHLITPNLFFLAVIYIQLQTQTLDIDCTSISLLYQGAQNQTQHVRCVLTSVGKIQGIQGKYNLLRPAGNDLLSTAKNTVSLLTNKDTLLRVQLGVYQDHKILFCRAAFQLSCLQYVLVHWDCSSSGNGVYPVFLEIAVSP